MAALPTSLPTTTTVATAASLAPPTSTSITSDIHGTVTITPTATTTTTTTTIRPIATSDSRTKSTLVPPTTYIVKGLSEDGDDIQFEYSVHRAPISMSRECKLVFGDLVLPKGIHVSANRQGVAFNGDGWKIDNSVELLCVPTFQWARGDLVQRTEVAESEKNRLLKSVIPSSPLHLSSILYR
jgi:hypothetical protein